MSELKLPASVNKQWINAIGFLCLAITFAGGKIISLGFMPLIFICMLAYVAPIIMLESIFNKDLTQKNIHYKALKKQLDLEKIVKKLLGLYFTYVVIIFLYRLYPGQQYIVIQEYWVFIKTIFYACMILAIPYFIILEKMTTQTDDAYWIIGSWLCFDFKSVQTIEPSKRYATLILYALTWIVKAYFIPVCFINLYVVLSLFDAMNLDKVFTNVNHFFSCSIILLFAIDVFVAMVGYFCTFKLFNVDVRTVEVSSFAWIVCLICYEPFNYFFLHIPSFQEQSTWMLWIKNEYFSWLWCFVLLGLLSIYAMATVSFGIRFSNLTHRGIITNGPFRYTKHPNYVFKNIYWWLSCFPFSILMGDWLYTIYVVLIMVVLNIVYYYRAKTEEAHLSKDPVYVQYALWMNEHGLFAPLAKRVRFLLYKAPV